MFNLSRPDIQNPSQDQEVLVTVVVPTRNRLCFLMEAIASVQRQSFSGWEMIVVDDASSDGTREWLCSLDDPRIRVNLLQRHCERSAARNSGLSAARGEAILFLDDDDRLRPQALEVLFGTLHRNPDAVAACGTHVSFDCRSMWCPPWLPLPLHFKRKIWLEVLFGWVPLPGETLMRSSLARTCGGWNEDPYLIAKEDQDLWLRLGQLGPAAFVPTTVLEYRSHVGQWRMADHSAGEMQLRESFLAQARPEQRRAALGAVRARAELRAAFDAHVRGDYPSALIFSLAAVRAAPSLLASPIAGPIMLSQLARAAVGAAVGKRGMQVARRARDRVKQATQAREQHDLLSGSRVP